MSTEIYPFKIKGKAACIITGIIVLTGVLLMAGCDQPSHVPGSDMRVAKVDTEYVYEANVSSYLHDYREGRRTRLSNFIGFSPDEILVVREIAIDNEIRSEIRRLPGSDLSSQVIRATADIQVEELARELHERIMENPEDFALIARDHSDGMSAREGGHLPAFGVVNNPEPYQELAYTMEPGEVSEPFNSWDGWRIIKVDEIDESQYSGTQYSIRTILLTADLPGAEASLIDEIAVDHTIEILDSKYNSRSALIAGDFETALAYADEAINRDANSELAHYLRARVLWNLERYDEAVDEMLLAAETGTVSNALIPYYHLYRAEFLEIMSEDAESGVTIENAIDAYHDSFESWRQDITIAYDLRDAISDLEGEDSEYYQLIKAEIEIIIHQDAIVGAFTPRHVRTGGGVIKTDQGWDTTGSVNDEPGYRASDR